MNDGKMLNVIKDGIIVKIHLIGCTNKKRPLLPSKLFCRFFKLVAKLKHGTMQALMHLTDRKVKEQLI